MLKNFNPDYLKEVIKISQNSKAKFVYNFLGGCFTIEKGKMIPEESYLNSKAREEFIRLSI